MEIEYSAVTVSHYGILWNSMECLCVMMTENRVYMPSPAFPTVRLTALLFGVPVNHTDHDKLARNYIFGVVCFLFLALPMPQLEGET